MTTINAKSLEIVEKRTKEEDGQPHFATCEVHGFLPGSYKGSSIRKENNTEGGIQAPLSTEMGKKLSSGHEVDEKRKGDRWLDRVSLAARRENNRRF